MAVMEVDYWKSRLSGAPALTEAPTDRQRPMTVSQEHCSHVKQQFLSSLQAGIEQDRSKDDIKCFIATVWQARFHPQSPIAQPQGVTFLCSDGLNGFFGAHKTLFLSGLIKGGSYRALKGFSLPMT
jgi:hypothetical protein